MGKVKHPIPNIGQKFGKLVCAIPQSGKDRRGRKINTMICECGGKIFATTDALHRGHPSACRYCAKNSVPGETSFSEKFASYRDGAKARNIEFCLTKEQHKNIITRNCHYCNKPPSPWNPYVNLINNGRIYSAPTIKRAWINANGVDRIDNSKGYTKENCVPCCSTCNRAKFELSPQEYIAHCKKVAAFNE